MGFYDEMADIATDLLTEFKQTSFILIQGVNGTGNGPKYSPGQPELIYREFLGGTIRGVSQEYIDGKEIIASDMQVTLSVKQKDELGVLQDGSVRPTVKDVLKVNGLNYNIIADKTVPAAGVPVAYIFVIRK